MPDRPTREPTDLERRLHEVVRRLVVFPEFGCELCDKEWEEWQPERHNPGCLAAPGALGDER